MVKKLGLIGFSSTGKSAIANLAQEEGFLTADTDIFVEKKEQRSIQTIFFENGESYFRTKESEAIIEIIQKDFEVIAFGGGFHYNHNSFKEVKSNFITIIALFEDFEILFERCKNRELPILLERGEKGFRELYEERKFLYQKSADFIVDAKKRDANKLWKEIKELWNLILV